MAPQAARSLSAGGGVPRRSLLLLLGMLVTLALWALATELSFVAPTSELADEQQRVLDAAAAAEDGEDSPPTGDFYPEEIFETDWSTRIGPAEILHEGALHRGCVRHKGSVIPSTFGREGQSELEDQQELVNRSDPQLLERLRACPDVDIYLPEGLRSFGYCEDAAAYTKFLESRMLPRWVFEERFEDVEHNRTVSYHELCPRTPLIFFNHYWDDLPEAQDWPVAKPLYLMPNMEMYELESSHYWRADVILCKTALCARYLRKWFRQEGNPRATRVLYTRHTTSNLALAVHTQRERDGLPEPPAKNFSDVSFVHTAGTSIQKGTRQVLDCWLSHADLPPLELYMAQDLYDGAFSGHYGDKLAKSGNVVLHTGRLEPAAFGELITDASFFLCPSLQEGYGHYINQARSSRAFIFTTDVAPMNELVTPSSGALVAAHTTAHDGQFLGGTSPKEHALRDVPGFVANFNGRSLCSAVTDMLKHTTPEERAQRADRALQQYYFDTVFFAHKMEELRDFARAHGQLSRNHATLRHGGADAPVVSSAAAS